MTRADFWERRESAQETVAEVSAIKNVLIPFERLDGQVGDFAAMGELAELEGDDSAFYREAESVWPSLSKELDRMELVSFLSGKLDANNAILTVHAGAGGTESCDWCGILYRMYTRWLDERGFKYEIVDIQPGEEAGLKYATLTVEGEFAYG